MQFSTTKDKINTQKTWWQRFKSQPHQLFFTSSIFFSIFIMILTLFSFIGKTSIDFELLHGFGLNFAVFTNAFLGFLITVIPRYNNSSIIEETTYTKAWIIFQIGLVLAIFINPFMGKIIISFTMLYFSYVFYNRIKEGRVVDKKDSIYINTIFALGAFLLLVDTILKIDLNILIFYSYLLNIVFLVALRMVPSFYFMYTKIQPWQRPNYIRPLSTFLLILIGLFTQVNFTIALEITSFIAALFFCYLILKLNMYTKTPAILSILTFSFFWFGLGFVSLFIETIFDLATLKLSLHIFALGFVNTLLIGFGSRVVLGHSTPPQIIVADKITKLLFILTQVVLLSRIMASVLFIQNNLMSSYFLNFLHISVSLWLALFIGWSLRYGKILLCIKNKVKAN